MTKKGIIFDLDGVICFTDEYHYLAWKEMADGMGVYFDREINNRLRGVSRMASLEIILERYTGPALTNGEKEALATKKNDIYRKLLSRMSPADLSDDVKTTLDALRAKGLKLAIGSSSKNTQQILKQLGLGDFFDAVADGTMITKSKPDPEVFLLAASMLGVSPENAIVIEDAESGVRAAKAGHFRAIGIRTDSNDPDSDITIKKLQNLIEIL